MKKIFIVLVVVLISLNTFSQTINVNLCKNAWLIDVNAKKSQTLTIIRNSRDTIKFVCNGGIEHFAIHNGNGVACKITIKIGGVSKFYFYKGKYINSGYDYTPCRWCENGYIRTYRPAEWIIDVWGNEYEQHKNNENIKNHEFNFDKQYEIINNMAITDKVYRIEK